MSKEDKIVRFGKRTLKEPTDPSFGTGFVVRLLETR